MHEGGDDDLITLPKKTKPKKQAAPVVEVS